MRFKAFIHQIRVFTLLILWAVEETSSVTLDSNGGYHLTVAIEPGTSQPGDLTELANFVHNINSNLKVFSELLFTATEGRFFINSTSLVLPYHWDTVLSDEKDRETAIREHYNNVDIRMSGSAEGPHVENPNICGRPGQYIELPLNFFQDGSTSFGAPSKALLASWARYRWGTWEEHGYPGDSHFPYFYKPAGESNWTATGCSDAELEGELLNLRNMSDSCDASGELYPPDGGCRFVPNDTQDATRSLSYLHWLPSVTQFCTVDTHDADAPNKQNLYCDYQSISEVMAESPDGLLAVEAENVVPEMAFHIRYVNRKPLLYILVDGARFRAPQGIYDDILNATIKLFEQESLQDIPVMAAVFPPTDGSSTSLQELVPWDFVLEQRAELEAAIDLFRGNEGSSAGKFNAAIKEAIDELIGLDSPAGAEILVLKHGAATNVLDSEIYETELISRLKDGKIILHALEISGTAIDPKLHLERVALESGGSYIAVSPSLQMSPNFIRKVAESFEGPVSADRGTETIFKRYLSPTEQFTLPLGTASLPEGAVVHFEITTSGTVASTPSIISIVEGEGQIALLSETFEYMDATAPRNRKVLVYELRFREETLIREDYTFQYNGCDGCNTWLVALIKYPSDYIFPDDFLTIEITTSEAEIDLGKSSALHIFATIMQNGQPVVGITEVQATLHRYENSKSYDRILLQDNGPNSADITSHDGIYSGSVVPEEDGLYFVTVLVKAVRPGVDYLEGVLHKDSAVQRLLPVNQSSVGCASNAKGCAITVVPRSVVKFQQLGGVVSVTNSASVTPYAARILDLDAVALRNFQVKLTWTAPAIFGQTGSPDQEFLYEVRYSTSPEDLRKASGFQDSSRYEDFSVDEISFEPGYPCVSVLTIEDKNTTGPIFFAVRLSHRPIEDDQSPPSNIKGVTPEAAPIPTTTTTTTLATPAPTEGTTTTPAPDSTTMMTTETTMETTTDFKYWHETTEGILTLSFFSGGVVFLVSGYLLFRAFALHRAGKIKAKAQREMRPQI